VEAPAFTLLAYTTGRTGDVHGGVEGSHFMKVDPVDRTLMHVGYGTPPFHLVRLRCQTPASLRPTVRVTSCILLTSVAPPLGIQAPCPARRIAGVMPIGTQKSGAEMEAGVRDQAAMT
jgi:hypothetical protein